VRAAVKLSAEETARERLCRDTPGADLWKLAGPSADELTIGTDPEESVALGPRAEQGQLPPQTRRLGRRDFQHLTRLRACRNRLLRAVKMVNQRPSIHRVR